MRSASPASASRLSHWYSEDKSDLSSNVDVLASAQSAFEQALETFKQKLTRDPKKRQYIDSLQATSVGDILSLVSTAQQHYESKHTGSKARRCITELSKRICHYGNVMDVMVQHHPEYVALAWGAIKVLFGAIVEHEKLGTTIVAGLCDVADALPQVELAATLYPTNSMKQAVVLLYAYIMKFLVRALEWYEEGKIAHAIHSLTKPAALRYDDLIRDIQRATRNIGKSAIASSQAEQRDMHDDLRAIRSVVDSAIATDHNELKVLHKELRALTELTKNLRENILLDQSINASARIEFRHALSDIQLTQALSIVSSACSVDHKSNLTAALIRRNRHRSISGSKCTPFWLSAKLESWEKVQSSSSILLKAVFKDRHPVQDFCTSVIEQLVKARTAVLWALKSKGRTFSAAEILKSLVQQALSLDYSSHTDLPFSFQLRKFIDAHFEEDYVNLLGAILQHFRLAYIIIEAEIMTSCSASQFRAHFDTLSQRLSERGAKTILKVMILTYRVGAIPIQQNDGPVLKVGRISRRKGKRLPTKPLRDLNDSPRRSAHILDSSPSQRPQVSGNPVRA